MKLNLYIEIESLGLSEKKNPMNVNMFVFSIHCFTNGCSLIT